MIKGVSTGFFIKQYAEKYGVSETEAGVAVHNVLNLIQDDLVSEGDKVVFHGLFSLEVVRRKERIRFNVNKQESCVHDATNSIKVTPSRKYRKKLNSTL